MNRTTRTAIPVLRTATLTLLLGFGASTLLAQTPAPATPQAPDAQAVPAPTVAPTPKSEEKQTRSDIKEDKSKEKADKATRKAQKDQDKTAKDQAKAARKAAEAGTTPPQ